MRQLVELALFTQDVPGLVAFYGNLLGGPPAFQSEGMALFQLEGLAHLNPSPGAARTRI